MTRIPTEAPAPGRAQRGTARLLPEVTGVEFAAGLAASGAALGGRPRADDDLPPARAVTPPS